MSIKIDMSISADPYEHQIKAFKFVCSLFGLIEGGDDIDIELL
jgi:hypothetical protein